MEDGNKRVMADMDWTRHSWRPRLCHPYPKDRCEPWCEPRVGQIHNCQGAPPPCPTKPPPPPAVPFGWYKHPWWYVLHVPHVVHAWLYGGSGAM